MSRKPSEATQLRSAKSEIVQLKQRLLTVTRDLDIYQGRAQKSEKECSEWKSRFDLLLSKTPENCREE